MASVADAKVLIIGGGLFGLTTALALAEGPYAADPSQILVLDRSANPPELDAASSDINKITRGGDYSNKIYADLGARSLKKWQEDDFWKPHFHQSGIIIGSVDDAGPGRKNVEDSFGNLVRIYEAGGSATKPVMLDSDQSYQSAMNIAESYLLGPRPDLAYFNDQSGWSAARDAMVAVAQKCRALGVRFESGLGQRLLIEDGDVRGVECTDGRQLRAGDLTILAAGSWTCAVLPELRDRLVATGQVIATIQLSPAEAALYKNAPVFLDFKDFFYVFPPNEDGIVKLSKHARGYLNKQVSLADPEAFVSMPRTALFAGNSGEHIPKPALDELRTHLSKIWPRLAEKPFASTRMCWYCDTEDEDWLISYHDRYPSLFLATGGSGHAFKFAPVMGELCLAAIERRLPEELSHAWSYGRSRVEHLRPRDTVIQGELKVSEFATAADLLR